MLAWGIIGGFIVGAAAGVLVGWLWKSRHSIDTDADAQDKEQSERFKNEAIVLRAQLDASRTQLEDVTNRLKIAEDENKENIAKIAESGAKIATFVELRENMTKEFKVITSELLDHQKKSVSEEQGKTIKPVTEQMDKLKENFDKQMIEMRDNSTKTKTSLEDHLKRLVESTGHLQKEASELANALKQKKQQGNWGEFQLERIFEILGFREGIEYEKEVFAKSEDGNVRPDYVLNLPNDRRVIIDSKLSLESYIGYVNSETETEKKQYIREFVKATKAHIDKLGKKEYQNKLKDSQLDYVFMFMPLEHSYLAALEEDPGLYEYSFKNNVALTTPSLLFPMMRTVDVLLKIEKRDKNIEEVIGMVNSLYEKYVGFTENFKKIGTTLESSQKSYNDALGQLATGTGNMSGWFDKIQKKSGIKSTKKIAIPYDGADE